MVNEKAVAVAEDVIQQAEADRLRLDGRGYLSGYIESEEWSWSDGLDKYLDEVQHSCSVCALGAALLSKARLYDGVPVEAVAERYAHGFGIGVRRYALAELLRDVFDEAQCDLVEAAYEQTRIFARATDVNDPDLIAAANFCTPGTDNSKRLVAIMRNVVKNGGVFKPGGADECQE